MHTVLCGLMVASRYYSFQIVAWLQSPSNMWSFYNLCSFRCPYLSDLVCKTARCWSENRRSGKNQGLPIWFIQHSISRKAALLFNRPPVKNLW